MKIGFKFILAIALALVFFTGCKSKKAATSSTDAAALVQKNQKELFADVLDKSVKYSSISTKGSIEFRRGNSSRKMPAVIKLIKDSVLQVSIRIPLLGSEAMRVNMTPQGFTIIDRLTERYATERFENIDFLQNIDLNYYNLQALLTNQLFLAGKKDVQKSNSSSFSVSEANNNYVLKAKDSAGLMYNFTVNSEDRLVLTAISHSRQEGTIGWGYEDFIDKDGRSYPQSMVAKINVMKKKAEIAISYNNVEFDKNISVDLSEPRNYKKVSVLDIVSSYMNVK